MAVAESLKSSLPYSKTYSDSSTFKSFEEVYKTSYSHGLEAIYAIENIDLNSIRKIKVNSPNSKPVETNEVIKVSTPQLEFDFGDAYRSSIEPFILREPIQVLSLSKHAEKSLIANQKVILKDLLELNSHVFFKGLGQGHLDEIQSKLKQYLKDRDLKHSETIDFDSWMRSLTIDLERKKGHLVASKYNLQSFFPLSLPETVELSRLNSTTQIQWEQHVLQELRKEDKFSAALADMKKILNVFVRPWMQQRLGIAKQYELIERLQRLNSDTCCAQSFLALFGFVYFRDHFPLAEMLWPVEDEIYCVDASTANLYQTLVNRAQSYFYKPSVCYTLNHLIFLLTRDFAAQWQQFPNGFIEKTLRYSSCFKVRREAQKELIIRLAL